MSAGPTIGMRPIPDAAAWARLSALFDTGSELPPALREAWFETLIEDEAPDVIDWLRGMLAAIAPGDAAGPDSIHERGPLLPAWRDPGDEPNPITESVSASPPDPAGPPEPTEGPEQAGPTGTAHDAAPVAAPPPALAATPMGEPALATPDDSEEPSAAANEAPPGDAAEEEPGAELAAPVPAPDDSGAPIAAPEDVPEHLPEPEPEQVPRRTAPALATGLWLGPWLLLGPMTTSDARVDQWRARRAGEGPLPGTTGPTGQEVALLVPRQWRPRTDLAAWLAHASARSTALVHPHIARLTEVGVTDDGTPWMAAEMAEGQSIDRWCRDHPLGPPERRALLEQALEAATFAHGRLVLHGHVHPSQIILTPDGRLRFLNFGLSELLGVLDTPQAGPAAGAGGPTARAYAAPEQQGEDGGGRAAPSAAADIYALGLVAFEVLSGASPWQPRAPGTAVVAAPGSHWPRPSDFAGAPRLRRALRGDLDAIVVKATQTDPSQRYASAAELLDDVRRVGRHRPISAVDGGFLYQMGRLTRRHPRLASVAMAGAMAFALFLGALSWKAWVWTTERDNAEAARRSGEAVTRLVLDLLHESTTSGTERDWPDLLTRAEAVARSSLKEHPAGLAAALALIGRLQAERGGFAEARNLLAEAMPNLADPDAVLEAGCNEGWAQARQGDKPEEAEQRVRRVTENKSARPATRVLCLTRLADIERRSGRMRDAYQSSFSAWRQWEETEDKVPQLALLLSRPMGPQSAALGRFHESQLWFEWALKKLQVLLQDQGAIGVELREQWGEVSLAAGDAERAVKLADENLTAVAGSAFPADTDPATAAPALLFLAAAEPRLELQRFAEARARLERVIALADARDDAAMRQRARCAMATVSLRERDAAGAERWLKAASPEVRAGSGRTALVTAARPGASAPSVGAATTPSGGAAAMSLPAGLGTAPPTPAEEARDAARTSLREADHACRTAAIELSLLQGRPGEAQREADRLLAAGEELSPRLRAVVNLLRTEATLAARQYDRAISAGLQALQQARALHQSDVEDQKARASFRSGQAALVLAEAHRANGDIEEAKKTLDYALQQLSATLPESHPWQRRAEATKAALAVHSAKKP